jgi:hypothetical protein
MNKEVIHITADDFIESPEGQKLIVKNPIPETAFSPEVAEAVKRTFNVDDRIRFDMDGKIMGTGTVLGLGLDHIIKMYIVLLDTPIQGQKAILCSNTLMNVLPPEDDPILKLTTWS